jgi:hypothetical protein
MHFEPAKPLAWPMHVVVIGPGADEASDRQHRIPSGPKERFGVVINNLSGAVVAVDSDLKHHIVSFGTNPRGS